MEQPIIPLVLQITWLTMNYILVLQTMVAQITIDILLDAILCNFSMQHNG